jgi:hypothetical protein
MQLFLRRILKQFIMEMSSFFIKKRTYLLISWRQNYRFSSNGKCHLLCFKSLLVFLAGKCRYFTGKVRADQFLAGIVTCFFGGKNNLLVLAGKMSPFPWESQLILSVVRQLCIPFTTSEARNSVRSIYQGWPGRFSLLNILDNFSLFNILDSFSLLIIH